MVRMIGEVAYAAGLETVAEYVESAAAMELLEKYGIDYAQGFLYRACCSKPSGFVRTGARAHDSANDASPLIRLYLPSQLPVNESSSGCQ
jgi:EAL domain-containing protein (putative c-di-GMP-specific phosphodiesterase class I)